MNNPLLCEVLYLGGIWGVVVGYEFDGNGCHSPWSMDPYYFVAKPTKRQLRKLKRKYR